MELIKDEYTIKDLLKIIIILSAGVYLSYVVTNSFLRDDHKVTRKLGFVFYLTFSLLFALLFKLILNFSCLTAQKIHKNDKLAKFKDNFIFAYWPIIFAFFISIYLFISSKALYARALGGEIDFYESELINIKFIPLTLLITFVLVLISKIYILYKSEKVSFGRSIIISVVTSFVSFTLFLISIGTLKILAYVLMAFINLAGGAPFGP